jgi:recombinational DNA repair ATPase RecF
MSELDYLQKNRNSELGGEEPVLLLDDIFSEFDPKRRSHLTKLILCHQSFITSTELANIPKELQKDAKITELE